jgi:hypothetical protein
MTKAKKIVIACFIAVTVLIIIFMLIDEAQAGGWYSSPPPEPVVMTTITTGISHDELSAGLSAASAAGGHQFDFGTYDWQGSVVGAWYDEEDAVSFGAGKRFRKLDAMFHGSYTQNGSDDLYMFGGTFRF